MSVTRYKLYTSTEAVRFSWINYWVLLHVLSGVYIYSRPGLDTDVGQVDAKPTLQYLGEENVNHRLGDEKSFSLFTHSKHPQNVMVCKKVGGHCTPAPCWRGPWNRNPINGTLFLFLEGILGYFHESLHNSNYFWFVVRNRLNFVIILR